MCIGEGESSRGYLFVKSEFFLRQSSYRALPLIFLSTVFLPGGSLRSQTTAGELRGTVRVPAFDQETDEMLRSRSMTRYEMHLHTKAGPISPYRLSEKAVVYIESVPRDLYPAIDPPSIHPQLNQTQMLFRPLVLPILVGTTIDFPNNDDLFHNVFSYSQPKEFDLGRYPRGQSRSVRFDKPGTVKVYCDIHTYMYATILVLENPFFTAPDDNGNFVIKDVPPGTYKVSLWYGRKKSGTKTVAIEEGKTSTVNFDL